MINIKEVLNHSVEEILASSQLTISLLKCYSVACLGSKAPRGCSKSIKKYYLELKQIGAEKLETKMSEIMNKTCVLKPGLLYLKSEAMHFSNANMTDATATRLLKEGKLTEDHFIKLPDAYKKNTHPDLIGSVEIPEKQEIMEETEVKEVVKKKVNRKK